MALPYMKIISWCTTLHFHYLSTVKIWIIHFKCNIPLNIICINTCSLLHDKRLHISAASIFKHEFIRTLYIKLWWYIWQTLTCKVSFRNYVQKMLHGVICYIDCLCTCHKINVQLKFHAYINYSSCVYMHPVVINIFKQ